MRAADFGLEVQGSSAGQELVLCPFHNDNHASAWFEPNRGLFYCAVCGVGFNSYQLAEKLGVEYDEIRWGEDDEIGEYNLLDASIVSAFPEEIGSHPYLEQRMVSSTVAKMYGLRQSFDSIIFPIRTINGHEIGHVKRFFDTRESGTRYKVIGKQTPVWPIGFLKQIESEYPVIVTEGAWSAMRINTVLMDTVKKFAPCLALFGAKANQLIVNCLNGIDKQVVFLYDRDEAGKRACRKMRTLMPYAHSFVVSTSPDDMTDEEIIRLMISIIQLGGAI